MTECRTENLQKILLKMLHQESGAFGIPLIAAKKQLLSTAIDAGMNCNERDVDQAIRHVLDNWIVDKALAPVHPTTKEKLGLNSRGLFWHLKILSSEEQKKYKSLEPVEKALVQLLRKQNEPCRRGQLPVEKAIEILSEQGFDEIPRGIWVEDVVEGVYRNEDNQRIDYYIIVEEHFKTEEYKKQEQKMLDKSLEKQRRYIQLMEDLEGESRQRRKREEEAKQQKKRDSKTTEMKPCNQDWLRTHLIQVVEKVEVSYGVPIPIVERELMKKAEEDGRSCSLKDIRQAIESALDEWVLDKTTTKSSPYIQDLPWFSATDLVWGLKVLSEEQAERYRNLEPLKKELIDILRDQDDPVYLGMMPVSEAHRVLSERGFDDIPELICEEGIIQENYVEFDGEVVRTYEIIEQWYRKQ